MERRASASIRVDVTWTLKMDLNIGADDIYPFLATVFTDGSGHYQQDNALCDTVKNVQKQFEEHDRDFELSCRLTST